MCNPFRFLGLGLSVVFSVLGCAQETAVCNFDVVSSEGGAGLCNSTPWCLVFSDEFDGSSVDESKWRIVVGQTRGDESVEQWFTPENLVVENGYLHIQAKHQPGIHTYVSNWDPYTETTRLFPYTAGEVASQYRYGEGLYIARCRIPHTSGRFHPAFWLYGQDGTASNELDVFEYWDVDWSNWHTSLHKNNSSLCGRGYDNLPTATEFKEYRLGWERFTISWHRDDLGLVRVTPRWSTVLGQALGCNSIPAGLKHLNLDYPSVPPNACNILFSLGVGSLPSILGPQALSDYNATQFPAAMVVDYVRYYRRVPCLGSPVIEELSSYLNANGEYNFLTGIEPKLLSLAELSGGQQLEVSAVESVVLGPGFVAQAGSDFQARIGPSNCGFPQMQMESGNDNIYILREPIQSSLELDTLISPNLVTEGGNELSVDDSYTILEQRLLNIAGQFLGQWRGIVAHFPNLPAGIYLLESITTKGRSVKRIIIAE